MKRDRDKAILISIRPEHVAAILSRQKLFELRRRFTRDDCVGAPVLIYSSGKVRAIVARAVIVDVLKAPPQRLWLQVRKGVTSNRAGFLAYFEGCDTGIAIRLGRVTPIRPIALPDMRSRFDIDPPQSFRFAPKRLANSVLRRKASKLSLKKR